MLCMTCDARNMLRPQGSTISDLFNDIFMHPAVVFGQLCGNSLSLFDLLMKIVIHVLPFV